MSVNYCAHWACTTLINLFSFRSCSWMYKKRSACWSRVPEYQARTPENTASNSSVQQHHPTEYSNSLLPPTASRKKPEPVPFNTQRQGTWRSTTILKQKCQQQLLCQVVFRQLKPKLTQAVYHRCHHLVLVHLCSRHPPEFLPSASRKMTSVPKDQCSLANWVLQV